MKINILKEPRIICSHPDSLHNYVGWPSVARLQDGSLMVAANGFRMAHICPFGKIVAIRSRDEGRSWTAPEVILDTPLDDRGAGIATFGDKGVIISRFVHPLTSTRRDTMVRTPYAMGYLDEVEKLDWQRWLGTMFAVSHDGGATFETVRVPVDSNHGPCELQDGTVLLVGLPADRGFDPPEPLECHTFAPDGSTAFLCKLPAAGPNLNSWEPHAIQLADGRILVHIRVQDQGPDAEIFTIYQSISEDMGHSFSTPVPLLEKRGGSPAHLIQHSSGTIISVYSHRHGDFGVRAMFSRDGAASWDTDNVLIGGEPSWDTGYPASVELADGNILTVWYTGASADTRGGAVIKQVIWNFEED